MSSGKSSLLNAALGIAALPVGVTPVTAVPTRVAWGETPEIQIRFADAPDERGPLEHLTEYVSEAGNPGNARHVVRALVRLRLRSLKTASCSSIRRASAPWRLRRPRVVLLLPRCDLGILLLDAASSPGLEDLDILRRLYDSGIPGMAVLSKADLVSEPDRLALRAYVRKQIAEGLGLDLPVHLVSTVGAGAALAHEWFEREIAPLCARAQELADASARRKLAGLREGVAASLEAMLKTRQGDAPDESDRPASDGRTARPRGRRPFAGGLEVLRTTLRPRQESNAGRAGRCCPRAH